MADKLYVAPGLNVKPVRKPLFDVNEVMAKLASPTTLNNFIKDVLTVDKGACYAEIEMWLLPPGISGSRAFDQAYAIEALLRHDAQNGGQIAVVMENQRLSRRLLWDRLQSVLKNIGFKMSHGRLVGLLEDKSKESGNGDDQGQPDIE